jgi:hypothetical protein
MKLFLNVVCLSIILTCCQTTTAQFEDPPTLRSQPLVDRPLKPSPPASSPFGQPAVPAANRPVQFNHPAPTSWQTAVRALAQASSDDEKEKAKKQLKSELEKQYDEFLKKDQARVDQLFDRLKKLEEQLEKRKAAKERLVELKLELMVSEAEGLGWPTQNSAPLNAPRVSDPFSRVRQNTNDFGPNRSPMNNQNFGQPPRRSVPPSAPNREIDDELFDPDQFDTDIQ